MGVFDAYAGYIYTLLIFSFLQLYLQQFSRSIDRMSVFVMSGVILTFVIALSSLLLVPKWGVDGYLYLPIDLVLQLRFLYHPFLCAYIVICSYSFDLCICNERDVILFNSYDTKCHALVDIGYIQSVVPGTLPFD